MTLGELMLVEYERMQAASKARRRRSIRTKEEQRKRKKRIRINKYRKAGLLILSQCYDLTKGRNLLFDRASRSFDVLIMAHGYTYKDLMALFHNRLDMWIKNGCSKEDAEMRAWAYIIELRNYARLKKIKLQRVTTVLQELSRYYGAYLAKTVLYEYKRDLKDWKRKKEKRDKEVMERVAKESVDDERSG